MRAIKITLSLAVLALLVVHLPRGNAEACIDVNDPPGCTDCEDPAKEQHADCVEDLAPLDPNYPDEADGDDGTAVGDVDTDDTDEDVTAPINNGNNGLRRRRKKPSR